MPWGYRCLRAKRTKTFFTKQCFLSRGTVPCVPPSNEGEGKKWQFVHLSTQSSCHSADVSEASPVGLALKSHCTFKELHGHGMSWGQGSQCHTAAILSSWWRGKENLGDIDPIDLLGWLSLERERVLGDWNLLGGNTCEDPIWRMMTKSTWVWLKWKLNLSLPEICAT